MLRLVPKRTRTLWLARRSDAPLVHPFTIERRVAVAARLFLVTMFGVPRISPRPFTISERKSADVESQPTPLLTWRNAPLKPKPKPSLSPSLHQYLSPSQSPRLNLRLNLRPRPRLHHRRRPKPHQIQFHSHLNASRFSAPSTRRSSSTKRTRRANAFPFHRNRLRVH